MAKLETVLIVDDSAPCVEFMSLAFEAEGGVVVSAETQSGRALDRIRKEKPGLILLDIKMPDIDGFGVLSFLRAEGNASPVIMFSGSARQADIDRAYALGCNGYMEKPDTIEDYRAVASAVIGYWRRGELPAG